MNNIFSGIELDKKNYKIIYFFTFIASLFYVVFRAYNVEVTHDEAWTLYDFVTKPILDILTCQPCDANNHILNTLSIKGLFSVFGSSVFIARVPNILGFIFYAYFAHKITSKYLSSLFGVITFICLIVNPFLMDFFSLARGYGLSFGLMMASIYYVLSFFEKREIKYSIYSYAYAAFAVLANLSILNYLVVLIGVINLLPLLWQMPKLFKQTLLSTLINSGLLFATLYVSLSKGLEKGIFYYGGNDSFFKDSLYSLVRFSLYNKMKFVNIIMITSIVLLIVASLLSFIHKKGFINKKTILLILLLFPILSTIVQHHLLGTLFLWDRATLFLYPLYILAILFCLEDFNYTWYAKTLAIAILIGLSFNFLKNANFYKAILWQFDAHNLKVLNTLNKLGEQENRKINLDYIWWNGTAIYYYNKIYDFPYLNLIPNAIVDENRVHEVDYYILYHGGHERDINGNSREPIIHQMENKEIFIDYKDNFVTVYKILK